MIRIVLILLLLVNDSARGQMRVGLDKDSLRRVLMTHPPDTDKVATLILLGQQYENIQPDTAIVYYQQAGQLSQQLNYPAGTIRYINNYTAVLNVRGRFDEALRLNLQALQIAQSHGLDQLYTKALINTAAAYQYKENYPQAAAWYLKALPRLATVGDAQSLSLVYGNLCSLYRALGQPDKALGYARNSLQQAEKNEDPFAMGSACINMGNALKDEGLTDESLRYTRQAYAIGRRIPDSNMMETALINIGDAYPKSEDPDKYIPAFRRAQPLARALDDVNGQAIIWQGLAEGEYWKGNYAAAEQLLQQQAIPFAATHGQREVSRNLLLLLSDVEIALGRPKASVEYRRRYDSLSQALINRTMLKNIQELETKYQVERQQHDLLRKDLLLEQKDKQAIRQRSWLIVAVTGVLLLAALFIGTWSYFRQRQQLQLRAMEALQAGQENLRLRATLEGQTSERQRIGQEMHDDMGSGLTSLLFLSRTLGRSADAGGGSGSDAASAPGGSNAGGDHGSNAAGDLRGSNAGGSEAGGDPSPDAADHPDGSEIARAPGGNFAAGDPATIARIRQTAEQLIRKMNEIVWTLNHEQDTLESLVAYIRGHAAELLEQAGIDVRFDIAENIPDMQLTQEFRRNIYLAVKEAVHNIVRHSGAGVASINIHYDAAELTVIVQDNGRGIYKAGGNRWGNGMKNMQHRVEQVGGRMEITAGGGTSITIIAPLPAAGDPSPIDPSS